MFTLISYTEMTFVHYTNISVLTCQYHHSLPVNTTLHQTVLVHVHVRICTLQLLVFNNLSLIYIDLLSQAPRLDLFREVWSISTAGLAPPFLCSPSIWPANLQTTAVVIWPFFTCLKGLLNSFILHQCDRALIITQQSTANQGSKDRSTLDYREQLQMGIIYQLKGTKHISSSLRVFVHKVTN